METDNSKIELAMLFAAVKKSFLWIVASSLMLGISVFLIYNFLVPRKYESSVLLLVHSERVVEKDISVDNICAAQKLAQTYSVILKSNLVLDKVNEEQGLSEDSDTLSECIDVSPVKDTEILEITVVRKDPKEAYGICSALSDIAPSEIENAIDYGYCRAVSSVTIDVNPIYPNVAKYTAFFAILGAFIALGAVLFRTMYSKKTLIDDIDVQNNLGLPVLCVIPDIDPMSRRSR